MCVCVSGELVNSGLDGSFLCKYNNRIRWLRRSPSSCSAGATHLTVVTVMAEEARHKLATAQMEARLSP